MFIDANIFLEVALNDTNGDRCESFLSKLKQGYTTDFIIYACMLKIENRLKNSIALKNFVLSMSNLPLTIIHPDFEDLYEATFISDKHGLDFDDALVVSIMKRSNVSTLVSYDKHFDKIKNVDRIEP
jgi:predicted nucleic acid-binding protein